MNKQQQENYIINFFKREAPPMELRKEMLQTPSSDQVVEMYYFLCDLIFDFKEMPKEFHDAAAQKANRGRPLMIIRTAQYLNLVLGDLFDDNKFSYSDLTIPDVDRTRFFLFTLINFYEFYKNRQVQIDRINEEMEGAQRNLENEIAFASNAKADLERERKTLNNIERTRIERTGVLNNLKNELNNQVADKEAIKREHEMRQKSFDENKQKMLELEEISTEAVNDSEKLDLQIVKSPDRINSEMLSDMKRIEDLNHQLSESTKEYRKCELFLKNEQAYVQKSKRMLSDLDKLERRQDSLIETKERGKSLGSAEDRRKELAEELRELERKNKTNLRKFQAEEANNHEKFKVAKAESEHFTQDTEQLKLRNTNAKETFKVINADYKMGEKLFHELNERYDDKREKLTSELTTFKETVNQKEAELEQISERTLAYLNIRD